MDLGFLKKKELGLPVWAWGLIVAVLLYVFYRHYRNASGQQQSAPQLGSTGDFGSGTGGGGGIDNSGLLGDIANSLHPERDYYQSLLDGSQNGDTSGNPNDANINQSLGASLSWGGVNFPTRAAFNAYLKGKGLSVSQFAARHPVAYAKYLSLPPGVTKTKGHKTSSVGRGVGAIRSGASGVIRRYYTYRKDVHLRPGQRLHFSRGKGYYSAQPTTPSASRPTSRPVTREPIPIHYYTYRTQVHLTNGQRLHFTRGRGYYAA